MCGHLRSGSSDRLFNLRRSLPDSGLLEVSFDLRATNGRRLATMDHNTIIADPSGFDNLTINASGTKMKARVTGEDIVLELETSRLTLDELDLILETDWQRYCSFVEERSRKNPNFLAVNRVLDHQSIKGTQYLVNIGEPLSKEKRIPTAADLEEYREYVISGIRRVARSNYFEGDGVPFLNIRKFKTTSQVGLISIDCGLKIGNLGNGFGCAFAGTGIAL
jgi:hypothetical protein